MLINIYDSVEACLCIHLLPRVTAGQRAVHTQKEEEEEGKKRLRCSSFYKVI